MVIIIMRVLGVFGNCEISGIIRQRGTARGFIHGYLVVFEREKLDGD